MATSRLAKILEASGEFSADEIAHMTEDEAWQWIHANTSAPQPADIEPKDMENRQQH